MQLSMHELPVVKSAPPVGEKGACGWLQKQPAKSSDRLQLLSLGLRFSFHSFIGTRFRMWRFARVAIQAQPSAAAARLSLPRYSREDPSCPRSAKATAHRFSCFCILRITCDSCQSDQKKTTRMRGKGAGRPPNYLPYLMHACLASHVYPTRSLCMPLPKLRCLASYSYPKDPSYEYESSINGLTSSTYVRV